MIRFDRTRVKTLFCIENSLNQMVYSDENLKKNQNKVKN